MALTKNDYHPDYNHNITDWDFFEQCYIGGRDWLTQKNVFQHAREDQDEYEKRVARAIYTNYCRPIIEIFLSFIYGVDTHRQRVVEDADFETFVGDVDLQHNTMDDFMSRCGTFAQTFGHVGVLVDMPQIQGEVLSLADVRELGLRPYLTCYYPQDIINWSTDRFGRLKWVKLREAQRDDDDPFVPKMETHTFVRTWTATQWVIQDDSDNIIETGDHNLGQVPFVPVYYQRHPRSNFVGLSQIVDISRINRLIANTLSYIDEFSAKQAFPFLAVADDGMSSPESDQTIGTQTAYRYPEGASPPIYVSPPVDPATFMQGFIRDTLIREIYRIAKLEHRILNEQSGVAKEMDFHETDNALVKYARNLELAETQIIQLWALWQGKESLEINVDYPDSFNIGSVNDSLENALKVQEIYAGQSQTFISEHLKRIAKRIEPKLEQITQDVIDGELDEAAAAQAQAAAFEGELRAVA